MVTLNCPLRDKQLQLKAELMDENSITEQFAGSGYLVVDLEITSVKRDILRIDTAN